LEDDTQTPKRVSTLKCYPNPFNRQTEFVFAIEKSSQVRLSIYNTLGQKIQTVVRDNFNAGSHSVIWDAEAVPSGVYFARLETEFAPENVKMVLLK
jgi:flagellar hook assembly protein FlgD